MGQLHDVADGQSKQKKKLKKALKKENVKCFLQRKMKAHLFLSCFTVSQEPLWTSDLL